MLAIFVVKQAKISIKFITETNPDLAKHVLDGEQMIAKMEFSGKTTEETEHNLINALIAGVEASFRTPGALKEIISLNKTDS